MRATAAVLLAVGLLAVPGTASAGTGYSRPAQYGIAPAQELKVKMSDGVMIAADVVGLTRDDKAAELVRRRAASACAPPSDSAVVLDA